MLGIDLRMVLISQDGDVCELELMSLFATQKKRLVGFLYFEHCGIDNQWWVPWHWILPFEWVSIVSQ